MRDMQEHVIIASSREGCRLFAYSSVRSAGQGGQEEFGYQTEPICNATLDFRDLDIPVAPLSTITHLPTLPQNSIRTK